VRRVDRPGGSLRRRVHRRRRWFLAHASRAALLTAGAGAEVAGDTDRTRRRRSSGRGLERAKRKRLAKEALTAALGIFENVRSELWTERARAELQRVATRRAPATLTPTERQIAQLAADGLTNKGIAARMFVSAKTVEANLSRVYRKLGISARTQLGRALAEAQPPPS
jgi:DNA-binding NarL/FixJ family response regulator